MSTRSLLYLSSGFCGKNTTSLHRVTGDRLHYFFFMLKAETLTLAKTLILVLNIFVPYCFIRKILK